MADNGKIFPFFAQCFDLLDYNLRCKLDTTSCCDPDPFPKSYRVIS